MPYPLKPFFFVASFSYLSVGIVPSTFSQGVPTIDVANIVQNTISAMENIEQVVTLYQQVDNQIQQIQRQVESFDNLNGDYLKHVLLNTDAFKEARRWVPLTYQEVLGLYENAINPRYGRTTDAGWAAREALQIPETGALYDDVLSPEAQRHWQREKTNMAAVGMADTAFQRVESLMDESEALIADIQSSPDAKAAQDLTNRMLGQSQILMAELLRIQSSQAATQGRNALQDHADAAVDVQMSDFNLDINPFLSTPLLWE